MNDHAKEVREAADCIRSGGKYVDDDALDAAAGYIEAQDELLKEMAEALRKIQDEGCLRSNKIATHTLAIHANGKAINLGDRATLAKYDAMKELRANALQSKVDRQRADIAKKDDQIRQLKEDKAMLLRDLKRLQSEAHGG
jgi:hypothetical protein